MTREQLEILKQTVDALLELSDEEFDEQIEEHGHMFEKFQESLTSENGVRKSTRLISW